MERPRGEDGTIPAKGDEDLESPTPLEPHLEQLLGEEEPSPVSTEVGDSPLPVSTPIDPELSPLCQLAWIEWHARHMEMLPWWRELIKIPSHKDYQEFVQKVCASFEGPKACNWVERVGSDHTPMVHPLIGKYHFLQSSGMRFGSQDY